MGDAQTASSDLESLMYCFLYVATQGDLPWARMGHTTIRGAPATFAKLACMTQSRLFDDKIAVHLGEPSLKAIARTLRGLFFPEDKYQPHVSASEFIAALDMLA